jgi:uncharacterized protein YeaO (DUF488 family)
MQEEIPPGNVRLKRAYERPAAEDGTRILVDRLWPRGLSKADAALSKWAKEIAPSDSLRKWFGHDPRRWPAFRTRYLEEISGHQESLDQLRTLARQGPITLIFAARDVARNEAVALREILLGRRFRDGAR